MIEYDGDEILQRYNIFTEVVKQLSMSAEEQIYKLQGTMVSDELATDFSEIGMPYARQLLSCKLISEKQFQLAESINMKLNQMSEKKELWNDESLFCSPEWEECRKSGKELLSTLEKLGDDKEVLNTSMALMGKSTLKYSEQVENFLGR